jgi:phosphate-selective porin OprO and OprP
MSFPRAVVGLTAALLAAPFPSLLHAQDEPPPRGEGSVVSFTARDDVAVTLSGYLQVDSRWLSGATQRLPDGIVLRRARFIVDAALPNGWHLRLQPDFGQGRVQVQDAFVGLEREGILFRAGRFRPNYGVERMQSSSTLLFPERSLINSLVPSRSFGTQLRWNRGAWTVTTGGFRTPIGTDAAAIDTDGDVEATIGSGHDVLLRTAWAWRREAHYVDAQGSVLAGRERGSLESPAMARILTVGQQPIAAFRNDGTVTGTVTAAGTRRRASVGAIAGTGRSMLALETAMLSQRGALNGVGGTVTTMGTVLRANRVWNGRQLPSQDIMPASARGAFEAGLRLGTLGSWGDGADALLSPLSDRRVVSAGIAVGWIPGTLTRMSLAYDITATDGWSRVREHALMLRVQQAF